jgi:hypothetical protein
MARLQLDRGLCRRPCLGEPAEFDQRARPAVVRFDVPRRDAYGLCVGGRGLFPTAGERVLDRLFFDLAERSLPDVLHDCSCYGLHASLRDPGCERD